MCINFYCSQIRDQGVRGSFPFVTFFCCQFRKRFISLGLRKFWGPVQGANLPMGRCLSFGHFRSWKDPQVENVLCAYGWNPSQSAIQESPNKKLQSSFESNFSGDWTNLIQKQLGDFFCCFYQGIAWDLKKVRVRGAWDYAKDDPDSILGGTWRNQDQWYSQNIRHDGLMLKNVTSN